MHSFVDLTVRYYEGAEQSIQRYLLKLDSSENKIIINIGNVRVMVMVELYFEEIAATMSPFCRDPPSELPALLRLMLNSPLHRFSVYRLMAISDQTCNLQFTDNSNKYPLYRSKTATSNNQNVWMYLFTSQQFFFSFGSPFLIHPLHGTLISW